MLHPRMAESVLTSLEPITSLDKGEVGRLANESYAQGRRACVEMYRRFGLFACK